MSWLLAAAFVSGLLTRDIAKIAWGRYLLAKFEREFESAKRRMIGCNHEQTMMVDVGNSTFTRKCQRCWALELPDYAGGRPETNVWHANSVPPGKEQPRPLR